jgi:hypothetical protein
VKTKDGVAVQDLKGPVYYYSTEYPFSHYDIYEGEVVLPKRHTSGEVGWKGKFSVYSYGEDWEEYVDLSECYAHKHNIVLPQKGDGMDQQKLIDKFRQDIIYYLTKEKGKANVCEYWELVKYIEGILEKL